MSEPIALQDLIARESPEIQAKIEIEYQRLLQEVEDSRTIHEVVRQSQAVLAYRMRTNQEVSARLERKIHRALRTLRSFTAKMGGEIEITIRIGGCSPIQLKGPFQNQRSMNNGPHESVEPIEIAE